MDREQLSRQQAQLGRHTDDRADAARLRELAAQDRAAAARDRVEQRTDQSEQSDPDKAKVLAREEAARERDSAAEARDEVRTADDRVAAQLDMEDLQLAERDLKRHIQRRRLADQDHREDREEIVTTSRAASVSAFEAQHDFLTGLLNRRGLEARFTEALRRAASPGLTAVLFCDLDSFKQINDTYGHTAGDQVLKTAAKRLQAAARANDTAARVGGDEFVLILEDVRTPTAVKTLTTEIRDAVSQPVSVDSDEISVSLSIGVAIAHPDCAALALMGHADTALHRAKAGTSRIASIELHTHNDCEPTSAP